MAKLDIGSVLNIYDSICIRYPWSSLIFLQLAQIGTNPLTISPERRYISDKPTDCRVRVGIKPCEQEHRTCCRFSDKHYRRGHIPYPRASSKTSRRRKKKNSRNGLFLCQVSRIKFCHTIRADTVTKASLRPFLDIGFHLHPESFIITNLFTICTDWNKPA